MVLGIKSILHYWNTQTLSNHNPVSYLYQSVWSLRVCQPVVMWSLLLGGMSLRWYAVLDATWYVLKTFLSNVNDDELKTNNRVCFQFLLHICEWIIVIMMEYIRLKHLLSYGVESYNAAPTGRLFTVSEDLILKIHGSICDVQRTSLVGKLKCLPSLLSIRHHHPGLNVSSERCISTCRFCW